MALHRHPSARYLTLLGALGAAALVAGCYSAEFDPTTDEVFACFVDEDCSDGSTCEDRICIVNEGPSIEVTGPEFLSALDEGVTTFDLTVRGSGLQLVPPGGDAVEGEGYLEVLIDDARVLSAIEGNEISSGNLSTGLTEQGIMLPDIGRSVHRLSVEAFYADGTPYLNRSATARHVFFNNVSDPLFQDKNGLRPQIAVLEPWPGQELPATEQITVSVAAINWDWLPPTTSVDDRSPETSKKEGHTHIYFNRDEESVDAEDVYPDCLPACNLEYVTTYNPDTAGTENSKILSGQISLSEEFAVKSTLDIRVGLQWNDHVPWPAPNNSDDETWNYEDPASPGDDINARELFVVDQIQAGLFQEE